MNGNMYFVNRNSRDFHHGGFVEHEIFPGAIVRAGMVMVMVMTMVPLELLMSGKLAVIVTAMMLILLYPRWRWLRLTRFQESERLVIRSCHLGID